MKALIPIAGLGTRMFPATKSVKKELLPVITPEGVCKPILQTILEEAVTGGSEEIALVLRPGDEELLRHFLSPMPKELFDRLPQKAKEEELQLEAIGRRVTFIHQKEQLGLGHAVSLAADWAGDEPVLLLLGDHIFHSNIEDNCATQLINAYNAFGQKSTISLYKAPGHSVHHYGTVTGTWLNEDRTVLDISMFAEKPTLEFAREHLAMPGLEDQFLCVYGQYVLTPEVFPILDRQIRDNVRQKGEFQLTTALDELRSTNGLHGMIVNGEHYDTGQPLEYLNSLLALNRM